MSMLANRLRSAVRGLANCYPAAKAPLARVDRQLGLAQHTLAHVIPQIIRPHARKLTVAITAHCNLRCFGCRYGRDFMTGKQLELNTIKTLLNDAKEAGIETVRLYGGEPLLHRALPEIVRHSAGLGLSTYVTTNGLILDQKIKSLFAAGLRNVTIGFYGTNDDYNMYVDRSTAFGRLERSISNVKDLYGSDISMQLNYLLMKPSCTTAALQTAWNFAQRYDLEFRIDLIHYSLPYFTDGPNHELQFDEGDRDRIIRFVEDLADLKATYPERIKESLISIFSIPDWSPEYASSV